MDTQYRRLIKAWFPEETADKEEHKLSTIFNTNGYIVVIVDCTTDLLIHAVVNVLFQNLHCENCILKCGNIHPFREQLFELAANVKSNWGKSWLYNR
ncbi:hypothetical protein GJ496_005872 [Pomphorhynchus laevis]|nr:hypothetical protein GJ496_005872 [Pomphorhynchus laevis]